jgi:uncharacterized protein
MFHRIAEHCISCSQPPKEAPLLTTWQFFVGLVSIAAIQAPVFGSDVLEYGVNIMEFTERDPRLQAKRLFEDSRVVALAEAAERGDLQKIDALLAQGVDVNTKGKDGITPLAWAMIARNKAGFQRLLQKGADPNHFVWDSVPIIQLAAKDEETSEWLRLCLRHKGNPNVVNRCKGIPYGQQTPIYWAFRSRRMESVDLLIQAGANLTHRDHSGRTPLLEALLERGFEWAYHLLEAGADFRVPDSGGCDLAFEAIDCLTGPKPADGGFKRVDARR